MTHPIEQPRHQEPTADLTDLIDRAIDAVTPPTDTDLKPQLVRKADAFWLMFPISDDLAQRWAHAIVDWQLDAEDHDPETPIDNYVANFDREAGES